MVEDLLSDAELIKREIKKSGIAFTDQIVETRDDYIQAILNFCPDVILSDYSLPAFDGLQALLLRKELAPTIPFILVTGSMNEETAVEVMKAGADDYIIKGHITRIGAAMKTAIAKNEIARLKKDAEEKLRESEEQYRVLFNDNISAMLLIDPAVGNIIDVNEAACKFYGYSRSEFTAMNIQQINTLTEQQISLELGKAQKKERHHFMFEHRLRNGSVKPVEVYSGNISRAGKTLLYSIVHDITDRRKAEKQIKTLSKAIEQSPSSIVITNADGKIEFVNMQFTSFMQYTLEEVKGRNPRIFNPGHAPEDVFENMWETLRAGNIWKGASTNRKKDKTVFFEEVIISPLLDDAGAISNYILIIEDITEKQKMLDDLIVSKEKAEESDRLKTAFLHNISHEIRTPMNAIVGFAEFLNDPDLQTEKRQQFTDIIIQSSNQLLSVITDIVNIATIEAGQEKIRNSETNLNATMQLLHDQFILKAQNKHVALRVSNALSDDEALITTDNTKLIEVLTNLIGNALKFTRQGYVHFGYNMKDTYLEFFVEDTGIGIPPEMHDEIFKRFRQVEGSFTRQFGGSGLGLSISKAYIELLGGTMWLTSEPDKGSIFYFTIPYQKAVADKPGENQSALGFSFGIYKPKTILIAEDEDSNYILLEELLSCNEITLVRASNGLQAVEICQANADIDLVLMDIKMPDMDGYEATKQIKAFRPLLPIIAQTAYTTDIDKSKAFTSGCSDVIIKPLKREILLAKIREFLDK